MLLIATIAAVIWKDQLLDRAIELDPQRVAAMSRLTHTDAAVGGSSTAVEDGPLRWHCTLTSKFDYPYCGYEVFFDRDFGAEGVNLTNLRSLTVTLAYRGPGKKFRLHLKNYDPRYSGATRNDSPKFNRVEHEIGPGMRSVTFDRADFGVADWWLTKHGVDPKLSHPQFDNITSLDVQTGTEPAPGRHDFEVRGITIHSALLTDAQFYLTLMGVWAVLLGLYLATRFRNMKGELDRRQALEAEAVAQAEAAEEAARRDPLTHALNRRGVAERYALVRDEAEEPVPLAVILVDLDRFKSLNDRFGHDCGDEVLSRIATMIKRNIRASDTICRWGGEEFLLLCPGIDADAALLVAEKLRRRIEGEDFGNFGQVTASFGVHWCPAAGPELATLVRLADVALYAAKDDGRNLTRVYRAGMAKAA